MKKVNLTRSSGNVFRDLGFSSYEADNPAPPRRSCIALNFSRGLAVRWIVGKCVQPATAYCDEPPLVTR